MKPKTKTQKKPAYLGIDLGGTKILLQGLDSAFKVCLDAKEKTDIKSGQRGLLDQMIRLIDKNFHPKLKGIGIGLAGSVSQDGKIIRTPHLPFKKNFDLKKHLEEKYKVPVVIQNDVRAFLLAEKERTELKNCQNLIAVMVGTGVGGAILINDELLQGNEGTAGEVGHMIIDASSKLNTLEKRIGGHFVPQLAQLLGVRKKITAYDLDAESRETDLIKKSMVKDLGMGLASLNLIFNPEAIVLGGSIYRLLLSRHKKELQKIIKAHSPSGTCPRLMDTDPKSSVAEGAVRELGKKKTGRR